MEQTTVKNKKFLEGNCRQEIRGDAILPEFFPFSVLRPGL
jgi:hypothetical protein